MRNHNDDQHDALNDYLDSLAGAPPAGSRAGDLDATMQDGVDQFFDLAEQAGMTPRAKHQTGRPTMNATLPASDASPAPQRKAGRNFTLPGWTQHLHLLSTGLLIGAVIALSFAAFGPNGLGGRNGDTGNGDGPGHFSAVPVATVPDDAVTSSIPYPTAEECTVNPMTREEIIEHVRAANIATEPDLPRYERGIEPTDEEASAIIQTFNEWLACGLSTPETGPAYELRLQTPWYSAHYLGVFYDYGKGELVRPITDEEIEDYVDVLLQPEETATPSAAIGTPPQLHHEEKMPALIPIPADATPVVYEGGRAFPVLFAEDIVITGPDTARATAYFVNEKTREVTAHTPQIFDFVKVDGQWLLNEYREGGGLG